MTPDLRGAVGKVARKPGNNHYIVKFPQDSQLYIFSSNEVEKRERDYGKTNTH